MLQCLQNATELSTAVHVTGNHVAPEQEGLQHPLSGAPHHVRAMAHMSGCQCAPAPEQRQRSPTEERILQGMCTAQTANVSNVVGSICVLHNVAGQCWARWQVAAGSLTHVACQCMKLLHVAPRSRHMATGIKEC